MVKILSYWQVRKQIKSKDIQPVYIFAGTELFLKRQVEELLKTLLFANSSSEFNQDIFYAQEVSLDKVLDTLRTQPFLSEKRLVILKNADKFSLHEKKLLEFLETKSSRNIFVLETEKKLSDRFIKKIVPYAQAVEFKPLEGTELNKWVNEYAQEKGKDISASAVALIVEKVGNDLESIINALNKLCLFASGQKKINAEDADLLIKKTKEDTRFDFLNALMSKQIDKALAMANELSRNGKNVSDLIGLINWQFKRLDKVKQMQERGLSQDEIISGLKMTPYIYKIVRKQAAGYSSRQLDENFRLLLESDIKIKQGLRSPGLTLETLIVRLCTN